MSLYTVKQMAMRYPAFTEDAFRKIIFNRHKNGFYECIIRVPGSTRILICEMSFLKWLRIYNEGLDECTSTNGNEAKPDKSKTYNRPNYEAFLNIEDQGI
ncbi:MAG: hypothetical protein CMH25_05340 [Micavibrio sp.]|nr:hypothetical protein [Micavibrio sp.]